MNMKRFILKTKFSQKKIVQKDGNILGKLENV